MTSIYRPSIVSLTHTTAGKSDAQLSAAAARNAADKSKRSKALPNNVVLPRTLEWAFKLPPDVQPQELLRSFGRIANLLAANWSDAEATVASLNQLLVDTRGCRSGFPPKVKDELLVLNCPSDPTSRRQRITAYLKDFRNGAIRTFNAPAPSLPADFKFDGKGQAETAAFFLRALRDTPASTIAALYTQSAAADDFERFFTQFSRAFAQSFE